MESIRWRGEGGGSEDTVWSQSGGGERGGV